jgi:prephenate dehydrogenase
VNRVTGSVRIVGAGLIGTSIGLALKKIGVDVSIDDVSPANQRLAIDYGAGRKPAVSDEPALIVVCVPPDVTARAVIAELRAYPNAVVTDVASVKNSILEELTHAEAPLARYIGSHPMAGRERGGALAGRADLFFGRPWVICANPESSASSNLLVEQLVLDLGGVPVRLTAADHDRAVAMVSHLPQLVSSLLAAQLNRAESSDLALSGQGLRDTTRIAASDAKLWMQILGGNTADVKTVLQGFAEDLDRVIKSFEDLDAPGALSELGEVLMAGNRGVALIPGKHGSAATNYAHVVVMIDDKPGQMAKLLNEIGEIGINLEDLKLEHSPGAEIGLVELFVLPENESSLVAALTERGWRLAG